MYIIYEYNTHICGIEHLIVKLSKLKVVSALRFYIHDKQLDPFALTQVTCKNECEPHTPQRYEAWQAILHDQKIQLTLKFIVICSNRTYIMSW